MSNIATRARRLVAAPGLLEVGELKPTRASFSPNLYRWMLKHAHFFAEGGTPTGLWRLRHRRGDHAEGTLFLGYQDPANSAWFIGSRMLPVLCRGAKATPFSIAIPVDAIEFVPDFWPRYLAVGRCAIDPEHTIGFVGDDTRFVVAGLNRQCNWCGRAEAGEEITVVTTKTAVHWTPVAHQNQFNQETS
jgi:hypothetical protein